MEKILVLGATGNIGTAVLKNLQNKNAEIFAGVQSNDKTGLVTQFGAKPIVVDFMNQESLNQVLRGMDRVFLVTPIMQNPDKVTEMVIKAAKVNNLKHLVRSTAAGANSKGPIQLSRWAGLSEELILSAKLNYTIIRPYTFLQNFINFHSYTIKNQNAFYLPVGNAKTSYIDLNNVGEVVANVLTTDNYFGKTIELSGLEYTHNEIAEIISKVLDRKISFVDVSEEVARTEMSKTKMPEWLINALMELNYATKQGWLAGYSVDYKNITGKDYTNADMFFEINKSVFI